MRECSLITSQSLGLVKIRSFDPQKEIYANPFKVSGSFLSFQLVVMLVR
jgi:hypothetical protein